MKEKELKGLLGKNVKHFRLRRPFSQAELAEKANISVTFLSNIERGNNYPQAGTLCKLANVLGINVWELFKGERASDEQKVINDRISEDYKRHINSALETVYKKYKA